MTIEEALRNAAEKLRAAELSDPRREASVLIAHVLGGDREIIFREPEKILTEKELDRFVGFVDRRCKREPASHILGKREFWSRDFFVSKHVLDPRPDSETLIEAVLNFANNETCPRKILDLGTGSGCLLLTLIKELGDATGVGVDFSGDALTVAEKNAQALDVNERVAFVRSRWFDNVEGRFDLIISNPPYIEQDAIEQLQPEVRDYEPRLALDGGVDGLDCYRDIISQASGFLTKQGFVIFEVGAGQADDVELLLRSNNFEDIRQYSDLAGIKRCVSGVAGK
ncbi:MAG: peptide chain release factor N(5)-glutamine methyltransferase [Sneathiella sp.]